MAPLRTSAARIAKGLTTTQKKGSIRSPEVNRL